MYPEFQRKREMMHTMTAQVHERLIYEGEETSMSFCPPIPRDNPRIVERSPEERGREDSILFSTACWRGYLGTWEIKDDKFLLVDLAGRLGIKGDEPIFASWFCGVLRIPVGEVLHYVHMGFGSVYEEEVHVKIEKGIVVGKREIDNRGKEFDEILLSLQNLPGWENDFEHDDDFS